jgi:hypothetical protein
MSNVPTHLSACEHLDHTIPISPSTFHKHQVFSTNKAAGIGFCCHGAVCRSASMAAQQAKAPWIINYRLVKQSSASNILMVYVQTNCKLGDDRMVYQALLYSHQYIYIKSNITWVTSHLSEGSSSTVEIEIQHPLPILSIILNASQTKPWFAIGSLDLFTFESLWKE